MIYLAEELMSRGRISTGLFFLAAIIGIMLLLVALRKPPGGE